MKLGLFFFSLLLVFSASGTDSVKDGLCAYEASGNPGLPKANCQLPSCPTGGDCVGPVIDRLNAKIEYYEPLLQWKDKCPTGPSDSACWEVYLDFKLRMNASDSAGIGAVGVNISQEIDGQKGFKKYWVKADKKTSEGQYELTGGMVLNVPAGKRVQLAVYELCGRDNLGNESCVSPQIMAERQLSEKSRAQ